MTKRLRSGWERSSGRFLLPIVLQLARRNEEAKASEVGTTENERGTFSPVRIPEFELSGRGYGLRPYPMKSEVAISPPDIGK
jgi:hypothetical protein